MKVGKTKKNELDVDFIGGQASLTEAEKRALSDFFSKNKPAAKKIADGSKVKASRPPKATA